MESPRAAVGTARHGTYREEMCGRLDICCRGDDSSLVAMEAVVTSLNLVRTIPGILLTALMRSEWSVSPTSTA